MEYFGRFGRWFSRGGGDVRDDDGDVHDDDDDVHDDDRGGDGDGLADCNDNCCVEPELNKQSKPKIPVTQTRTMPIIKW